MKLTQSPSFSPITLTLETREEAEIFWKIMREVDASDKDGRRMTQKISDMFTQGTKL